MNATSRDPADDREGQLFFYDFDIVSGQTLIAGLIICPADHDFVAAIAEQTRWQAYGNEITSGGLRALQIALPDRFFLRIFNDDQIGLIAVAEQRNLQPHSLCAF